MLFSFGRVTVVSEKSKITSLAPLISHLQEFLLTKYLIIRMITNMERRNSKQREIIYRTIKATVLHPTAQRLYDELRKEMPTLSMGNLYRNLKILLEEGRIKCRKFDDGIDHYDASIDTHYHFICDKCGCVKDINLDVIDGLVEQAQKHSRHHINDHTIQFTGICEDCKNGNNVS